MGKIEGTNDPAKIHKQTYFLGSWLKIQRPMTWTGTISPILAGTAFASMDGNVAVFAMIILLAAVLLIQVSANMLNDYFDYKYGQDTDRWTIEDVIHVNRKRPNFHHIPWVVSGTLLTSIICGIWITISFGGIMAFVGIAGIAVACFYSAGKHSLASLGLGELLGGLFLGIIPFMLAYAVQNQSVSAAIIFPALPFSFLIATMILTNNIRDIEKDHKFRRTLAIRIGKKRAIYLLYILVVSAYASILVLPLLGATTWSVCLTVIALPFAIKLLRGFRQQANIHKINKSMKWAALHHWCFSLFYILAVWIL